MKISEERKRQIINELKFSASKSSGPGGQHVNKVNTKVELRYPLFKSALFSEAEKRTINYKLANRINAEGEVVLVSSVERSQWRNKEKVIEKFFYLIEDALTPTKKRVRTKPTRASKVKRIEGKRMLAIKKNLRKKPEI